MARKPKKLEDFQAFTKLKKSIQDVEVDEEGQAKKDAHLQNIENLTNLLKEKYVRSSLSKSIGVVSKTNYKKKAQKLFQEYQKVAEIFTQGQDSEDSRGTLGALLEEDLGLEAKQASFDQEVASILFIKFSKNMFGKSFRPFVDVPENHLKQALKHLLKSLNLVFGFLSEFKKASTSEKIVELEALQLDLLNNKILFLYEMMLKGGAKLAWTPQFLTISESEFSELEAKHFRETLSHAYQILLSLILKIAVLNHSVLPQIWDVFLKLEQADFEFFDKIKGAEEMTALLAVKDYILRVEGMCAKYETSTDGRKGRVRDLIDSLEKVTPIKQWLKAEEGANRRLLESKFFELE